MSKVIAIANQKGGIGKTTTATSVAGILSERGYKTLLIDCDVQGNSTDTFRAQSDGVATLYDVMLEDSKPLSLKETIQHTEMGAIVASDPLLVEADSKLSVKGIKGLVRLKNAIKDLPDYDYIVLDTHPAIDFMLRNVLVAADEVIIPVAPGRYSFQGLMPLIEAIEDARALNPELRIAGFLRTNFKETNVSKDTSGALDEMEKLLDIPVFKSMIRSCTKVVEAQSARMTLIKYDKRCSTEHDYEDFIDEYLGA